MAIDERNIVFDFGFTSLTADELDAVQERDAQLQQVSASQSELETRLEHLYKAILPLLANLKKDADTREYIYWPERGAKIEEFESMLANIYYGKV